MGDMRVNINDEDQKYIVDTLFDREVTKFDGNQGKAQVTAIKEHVTLLTKKLIIIVMMMIVAMIGLVSLIIGAIAFQRNCKFYRQPSLPIWLIVLGGSSLLLIPALITLIILSTMVKYKSNKKAFRRTFMITVAIGFGVMSWGVGPGTPSMFLLTKSTQECLGFITTYCTVIYWILSLCLLIHSLYIGYKTWKRCCSKKNETTPEPSSPQKPVEIVPQRIQPPKHLPPITNRSMSPTN